MNLGQHETLTRTFTAQDLVDYQALGGHVGTGDHVPEPLIGGLFSYLLGMRLPGLGTNYLKQETRFQAVARIGEPLTAEVRITRLRPEKHLIDLATTCTGDDDRLIATGRALVYVKDVQP